MATEDFVLELLPLITDVINTSTTTGEVPAELRQAVITPILKKPTLDSEQLPNYRPISNLPFLAKVLERVVANRIKDHLDSHNLLNPLQSA